MPTSLVTGWVLFSHMFPAFIHHQKKGTNHDFSAEWFHSYPTFLMVSTPPASMILMSRGGQGVEAWAGTACGQVGPVMAISEYGGFQCHGGTPSHHPYLDWDIFFWNRPSSYWGYLHFRKPHQAETVGDGSPTTWFLVRSAWPQGIDLEVEDITFAASM